MCRDNLPAGRVSGGAVEGIHATCCESPPATDRTLGRYRIKRIELAGFIEDNHPELGQDGDIFALRQKVGGEGGVLRESFPRRRLCIARGLRLLSLILLSATPALNINQASAEEKIDHPFIAKRDIKSQTCVICHPGRQEGKFAHAAVRMGCESCHQAVSEDAQTTVTLVATGGELCALCHQARKDAVLHGPYKAGQCLLCHDPHTSDFPRLLRAAPNTLCMSCHGVNQPDVKANAATRWVALLGSQKLSLEDYQRSRKIATDRSGTSGHPVPGHPLMGPDSRDKNATISCLSCHAPHGSMLPNLMPRGVKNGSELCAQCHKGAS